MNQNLTELVVVLDGSGSMFKLQEEVRKAYNKLIADQREQPGDALVTLVVFADKAKQVYSRLPIQLVPELDRATYWASGWTALLDAVGTTIDKIGAALHRTPEHERPARVVFVVNTDGHENASLEHTFDSVRERVVRQRDEYNWQFIFMGADQDAWEQGGQMGVGAAASVSYENTAAQYSQAMNFTSEAITNFRRGVTSNVTLTNNDLRTDASKD